MLGISSTPPIGVKLRWDEYTTKAFRLQGRRASNSRSMEL